MRLGRQDEADVESWLRYWGTASVFGPDFSLSEPAEGFRQTRRIEGDREIIESESGAVVSQVIDNDITYSMPEFLAYPVRDRESWEFYRLRTTPPGYRPVSEFEDRCVALADRDRPLAVFVGGIYGWLRGILGPERLSLMMYDDPELIHDMAAWRLEYARRATLPLVERLKPETVLMGEDLCYNHGMLLSPVQFRRFCGEYYRTVCDAARSAEVDLIGVDSDGNVMEFVDVAAEYGVNGFFPCEVKAGNDLFELRRRHPRAVFFGWLEKECVNEGNEDLIGPEILSKVPELMPPGGYFPNGDHGIQPLATFDNLRRFMTLLHEVTGNPEGEFPRT